MKLNQKNSLNVYYMLFATIYLLFQYYWNPKTIDSLIFVGAFPWSSPKTEDLLEMLQWLDIDFVIRSWFSIMIVPML